MTVHNIYLKQQCQFDRVLKIAIKDLICLHFLSCLCGVRKKIPLEESPPRGIRGRIRVRLGIGLGLGSGVFFPGGFFPTTVLV